MSAPPASMVRCPRCRLTTVDRGYCPIDGARMAAYAPLPGERLARCPNCERILDADVSHCPEDGCRLDPLAAIDETAAPAPTPAPGAAASESEVFDGRYRLLSRIGAGGMGTVYRARQLNMDRDVAVKLIRADAAGDRERADRFRQEARIIARLQHPNVLTVIDFGCTAQGVLYLVTELLRGDALSERLEEGPLTPAVTIELLREVCGALVEAHDLGIVHRDLKPANLFLHQTRHNRVTKVLDFGVAKLVEEPGLTASGQLIGSPAYMSPEQCSGRSLDARSDLYSLGIVAYECLAGRPPFEAPTFVSLVAMQLTEAPAALPTRAAGHDVPTRLATLVEAMLAKRPDDRPASARAVLEALDEIVVDRSSGAASARALAMALDVTTDGGEP